MPSVAVLIPILTLPFWLFYFDVTPKVAALLLGTALACLLAPSNAGAIQALWRRSGGKRIAGLFGLLVLAVCLSTLFSVRPALSAGGSNWRCYGLITQLALLMFLLLAAAHLSAGLANVLRAVAVSGSAIALYAICQYFGIDPLLAPATYHIGEGEWTIVRPPGTIGHADYLGSYLVFVLFLGGSLWTREPDVRWRILGVANAALCAFAIVLSGTRSAILAAVCGCGMLAFRYRPSLKKTAAGLAIVLVAFAGFYYSPLGLKLRGRTRWYVEDSTGGARLRLWRDSLNMAAHRPAFGWGPETFGGSFPTYESQELARAYPDFYHESPHNIFVEALTDQGLLGLAALLAWTALASRSAWRLLTEGNTANVPLAAAWFAGLISLQFNAFVLTTAFFYFLVSMIVLLAKEAAAPTAPARGMWFAIAGLPLAGLFAIFAVRLCVADAAMASVRTRLEAGDVFGASSRYETVRRWEPRSGSSDAYYSRNMAAIVKRQRDVFHAVKAWQEAIQSGIRATAQAEDPQNAWYQLASVYAQVDNRKDAERCLRRSISVAPNWFKSHWLLAKLLAAAGRRPEALAEAAAAVGLDGGKHAEVTGTLRQLEAQ